MALDLWGPNGGERLASLTYVPEFYRTKGPEILPVVSLAHDLCNHFTRNRRNPQRKNFTAFFSVATFTTVRRHTFQLVASSQLDERQALEQSAAACLAKVDIALEQHVEILEELGERAGPVFGCDELKVLRQHGTVAETLDKLSTVFGRAEGEAWLQKLWYRIRDRYKYMTEAAHDYTELRRAVGRQHDARAAALWRQSHGLGPWSLQGLCALPIDAFECLLPFLTTAAAAALMRTCREFSERGGPKGAMLAAMLPQFRIRNLPGDAEHGWAREWAGRKPQVGLPHYQTWRADAAGELKPVNVVQSGRNVYLYIDFVSVRPRAVALRDGLRVSVRADGDEDGTREVCTRATPDSADPARGVLPPDALDLRGPQPASDRAPTAREGHFRQNWVAHEGPPEVLHPTREHRRLPWSEYFSYPPLMQLTLVDARSHRPVSGRHHCKAIILTSTGLYSPNLPDKPIKFRAPTSVACARASDKPHVAMLSAHLVCSVMGDGLRSAATRTPQTYKFKVCIEGNLLRKYGRREYKATVYSEAFELVSTKRVVQRRLAKQPAPNRRA